MWSLQPNRDDCWYDGPIGHWKVANGRDGEYSLLNIEGCPSWLVERFRTFQNLSDPDCNFTKTMFWHLWNQQWNAHFENPKTFDSYLLRCVSTHFCCIRSDPQVLWSLQLFVSSVPCLQIQKKRSSLQDPCGNRILKLDPSNSFFVATVFRYVYVSTPVFAEGTAKWNYPGIFGRMKLFNIYSQMDRFSYLKAPLRATMWRQCQDTKPHVFFSAQVPFFWRTPERFFLAVGNSDRVKFFLGG